MNPRLVQAVVLCLSAAVTLGGVVFLGWNIATLLYLYWLENVVIGFIQLFKIFSSRLGSSGHSLLKKAGLSAFFIFHYSGFCGIHGVFILLLSSVFTGGGTASPADNVLPDATPWVFPVLLWNVLVQVAGLLPPGAWVALGGIVLGHMVELIRNFFLNGAWKTADPGKLMGEPYKHILVVHVAIILGAALASAFRNPIGILLLVVIGKLLIDLRELRGSKPKPGGEPPPPPLPS